jgi:hypothetical protein
MKEFILWALVEYKKLSKIESPKDINLKIFTEVISVNCNSIYILLCKGFRFTSESFCTN